MNTLPLIPDATLHRCNSRSEWLLKRSEFMGSSDMAAVVGFSRFQSPTSIWYRKVEPTDHDEPNIQQELGHELEPFIARHFSAESGVEVVDPGEFTIYQSTKYPRLACTPDRLTHDGCPVELKTASFDSAKIWKSRIPIDYQLQLQHQLAVLGAPVAYVAVLLNYNALRWYTLPRHEGWIAKLAERAEHFWDSYVVPIAMPPVDGSEATRKVLEACYPPPHSGEILDLPADPWDRLAARWDKLQRIEARAKKLRSEIGNKIRAAIGSATYARVSDDSGWKWDGRLTRVKEVKDVADERAA